MFNAIVLIMYSKEKENRPFLKNNFKFVTTVDQMP